MKKTKLKDICNISAGGTPSRSNINYWNNGDIPWCKIGDFSGKYINQVKENITEEGLKNSSAKIFKRGTILYTIFATVGEVAILEIESATNQAIAGLELINNEVDLEYLYYYLKSLKFLMLKKSRGVAQNNINLGILKNIEIKIPDKIEQINIAKILGNIERIIDKKKKQLKELNTIIKSQFVEMFGDIHLNDKKWEKFVKMNEICEINPKKSEISDLRNIMVSFVPMQSVTEDGKIYTDDKRNINDVKSGFTYFRENDVLFAKITPCMENGKGAIAVNLENKIGFGSTEFHVIRPGKYVNPLWIYTLTATKEFRKQAEMSMTGSAGQKRVSSKYLENYRIGVPPIDLQNQFSEIVKQIDKQKFEIEKSLKETQELYESLMEKYFG